MYAESCGRPRSGLGGAYTVNPRRCSRLMTLLQPEASAQAPCTSTITGLAGCLPPDAAAPAEAPAGVARPGAIASRAAATTTAKSAGRLMRRAVRLSDMSVSSPEAEMRNCPWVRAFCLPVAPLSPLAGEDRL